MPIVVPPPPNPNSGLHPRLRTAFSVLGYCESITNGRGRRGVATRDLIPGELAARNAALELLRHYMTGEVIVDETPDPTPQLEGVAELAATDAEARSEPDRDG